jgi:hypothetical protein
MQGYIYTEKWVHALFIYRFLIGVFNVNYKYSGLNIFNGAILKGYQ